MNRATKIRHFILVVICQFHFVAFAELSASIFTPQTKTEQILYISSDDKIRYLKQTDEVNLYYNDGSKSVFKGKSSTAQYEVLTTYSKVKAALVVDANPLDTISLRRNKDIYLSDYAEKKSDFILMARGDFSQLHLNDAWLSFLDWEKRTLNLLFLPFTQKASYQLKLTHGKNPFFAPKTTMVNQESFFYTDGNEKGEEAVIFFNMTTKKFKIIHKAIDAGQSLSLCSFADRLFVAEWSITSKESNKIIELKNWNASELPKKTTLYENVLKHRGAMVCGPFDGSISFLRKPNDGPKNEFTVVQFKPTTQTSEVLLGDYSFTSLFYMDKRLMASEGGKFYVVTKK